MSENKLKRDVSALESRKQALQASLANEILVINNSIAKKCSEIGMLMYEQHITDTPNLEIFNEKFNEITEMKQQIAEKESKSLEIGTRYGEEIALLSNFTPQTQGATPTTATSSAACKNCNAPYRGGEDVFCSECGNKL